MKSRTTFAFLLSIQLLVTACATPIYYNGDETCAQRNMKLRGVSYGSGSSYNYWTGASSINTESVSCEVPENSVELCRIRQIQTEMAPKNEYNRYVGTKEFVNGLGYFVFIVPGIFLKLVFDGQKKTAIKKSEAIQADNPIKCAGL